MDSFLLLLKKKNKKTKDQNKESLWEIACALYLNIPSLKLTISYHFETLNPKSISIQK